jgi:hypothetical protein
MIKFIDASPLLFVASLVVLVWMCSVAFTDEFISWRKRIRTWWPESDGLSPEVRAANKARNAKFDQYVVEFLGYGFTLPDAQARAGLRLAAEAKAAEGMQP